MSEPSDEELERAERIRKLRSGGARSRGHEMRERRREQRDEIEPDDDGTGSGDETGVDDGTEADDDSAATDDGATAADDEGDDTGADESAGGPSPLSAGGEVDVLELAAALPEDGSLFVVPVREGLRRQFNKVAEQLHLRYGFEYNSELDADYHVRPLALYLGVQSLKDGDVDVVKELLESVDQLEAPGSEDE